MLNLAPDEKRIETQLTRTYDVEDPQFRRSIGVLLGPPILEGNAVQVLLNGDMIFKSMLNAIRGAQQTITFETYIYWSESIGKEFSEALMERARAGGSESMHLMYLMAITSAKRSIHLSSAYFVPDELTVKALVAAAKRGVKIQIITPGNKIDSDVVRSASRSRWGDLLTAGITISEFQPTMFHVKALVVDALLVSVGSTNFDNRSFRLNDEANLNVFDQDFAERHIAIFENDLLRSKTITLQAWKNRPLLQKSLDQFASLIGAQL